MKYKIIKTRKYIHGYETRIVLQTDLNEDLQIYTISWGMKEPTNQEIINEANKRLSKWEENYNTPKESIKELFNEDEITSILRKKGFLTDKENFSRNMSVKEII